MIESSENKIFKEVSCLKNKKYRDHLNKFVLEGINFIKDIPDPSIIDYYVVSSTYFEKENISLLYKNIKIEIFSDNLFRKLSDTVNPTGVLAVCIKLHHNFDFVIKKQNRFFVIGEEIQDPGNLGTLIRTAAAAGSTGVLLSRGCVDVYNTKTLRATAGGIFYVPVFEGLDIGHCLNKLKAESIKIVGAHINAQAPPYEADLKQDVGIIIGNESRGISQKTVALSDILVKIPMPGNIDSLNASVAGTILLYEVVRQRFC